MHSLSISGLRVDDVTFPETLSLMETWMREKTTARHIVTADASMTVAARADPELRAIVETADLVTPDGAGILWAARLLKTPLRGKVSGVDLVNSVCALSAHADVTVFFLGAGPGVAEQAANNLKSRHPNARIIGVQDGYFNTEQEGQIVSRLQQLKPDCVFVAFGIPKQEKWIAAHKGTLPPAVWVGVGGSFDVYSGKVKRAPRWMQNAGLEWLHRLASNPRKIGKVMTLPTFVARTWKQKLTRQG